MRTEFAADDDTRARISFHERGDFEQRLAGKNSDLSFTVIAVSRTCRGVRKNSAGLGGYRTRDCEQGTLVGWCHLRIAAKGYRPTEGA